MVKAWRELVTIPTYEIGKPEKNPMFLEKRVYQGSSGVVYPYPVIESIADEPTPHEWNVVWLENEYIKVMVMPELGGRIQMAFDKVKQRHFVYYNHVIKPALVGLAGPWISGGIEFNWPQHHRPSTYLPIDARIVDNEDGSVTVWVNEMERMFHQKGMAGFTLRPGCAYLEIQGRVSNRTNLPQTFLWWANPAVEVNDAYQSVFPPDVNAVFDHGKRAVSSFPIATGTYYKMDYSAGVDISNYKNIQVPTSYMAVNSKYDFEGGYENDTKGGMLHVASHHFSPGKKQWTWGNGDFGRAWDRNLTDEGPTPMPLPVWRGVDSPAASNMSEKTNYALPSQGGDGGGSLFRPYIELMAGIYTENQPDFTWLMPYEEKQFVQYFMPYREVGIVKQASKDFIFNIESLTPSPSPKGEGSNQIACFKILATSKKTVRIVLDGEDGVEYYNKVVTLSPESVFEETVEIGDTDFQHLHLSIDRTKNPRRFPLLEWQPEPDEIRPIPDAAEAALSPQDTKTVDQLYLTGLHLEQYRHATWSALDYYEEALRRDPNDVRCLKQIGLWYLRRGRFDKAEDYLQRAVRIWKKRNPNPYDGEALFYLGVVYNYLHKPQRAYDCFWKATWNKAWADAGYFEAACISIADERWEDALDELERSLISNSHNHQARAMKAVVLRKLGRKDEALSWIEESYKIDPFNYVCMVEEHLLTESEEPLNRMVELMHGNINNYHETALDYAHAELEDETTLVLRTALERGAEESPLTYYYLAYWSKIFESAGYLIKAGEASPDYCFPNRLEDIQVLGMVNEVPDIKDAKAPYYLGCLYYDKRQYDLAKKYWELSEQLDETFPIVHRNLALLYFNKEHDAERAMQQMERAFHLDETDSRMLMELDQLYKRQHKPHQERLDFLQKYPSLIQQRDDLVLEEITLLNQLGRYEEAMHKLDAHKFHPWEGGEGKVPAQYQICRVELAKQYLVELAKLDGLEILERPDLLNDAKRLLNECLEYPHHLGEGKLAGAQDNDFLYFLGRYVEGTVGPTEPAAALYYNDAKADKIFYAALCYRKLGQENKARSLFHRLVNYGKQHLFDHITMDYFAVSLPDLLIWDGDLDLQNRIHCLYLLALGYLGLDDMEHSKQYLAEAEALDNNLQGLQQLRTLIETGLYKL